MRKKAERQIRIAVKEIGSGPRHPINQVRQRAGLIRKVYDKTILDMARVGTIKLFGKKLSDINGHDLSDYIVYGEMVYFGFEFIDGTDTSEPIRPVEPISVMIKGIPSDDWDRFRHNCKVRENKDPIEKIIEMISEYNNRYRNSI